MSIKLLIPTNIYYYQLSCTRLIINTKRERKSVANKYMNVIISSYTYIATQFCIKSSEII